MLARTGSFRVAVSVFAFALLAALTFAGWNGLSVFTTTPASAQNASSEAPDKPSLTIGTCDLGGASAVEVEANASTTGYASLNAAFTAINTGTHTGSIAIDVCGNTTESVVASLDASGTGSASYTDLTIRPVGASRIVEGSITTAVIKLNGADNVTIDGRIGGVGAGRDLTVRNNNSTAAATAAIWLASVVAGNGASNNVIRNLEIATGQTANVGTLTTIGIYMGGSTVSLSATTGNDNDYNVFIANRILRARYGIATRGTTTNLNINPVVTDNIIGPTSFGADEIGKVGIFMQADTGATVSRNTVQFVGGDLANTTASADRMGIAIGNDAWSATDAITLTSANYTVTKNIIHDVVDERTGSAVGIKLGTTQSGGATNNLVANNFIYNLRANGTGSDQVCGIGIAGGNGDRVVFNSISITGDMDPGAATASSQYGNAIRIPGANGTNNENFTIMNNSIYLDVNSNTATVHFYAITLNSVAYSFGTGGLNHNNYYINQANPQLRTGGLSTTSGVATTTEFQTLANWQAALTPQQDANSIQADPLYISNTSNLHLQAASPNINAGLTIAGVTDDIDAQIRGQGSAPDMGADEVVPSAAGVSLGGRILTANGQGIRNAVITVEGGNLPGPMVAISSSFGYYQFDDLPAGLSYIVTVGTKRYTFANPSRLVNLDDAVLDVDFIAEPTK